jgi:diacylglycerol kinase family enzyme
VAGGDGTVAAAATVAAERELPLAVVPAGTLNHFARDLRIPTRVRWRGRPSPATLAKSASAR